MPSRQVKKKNPHSRSTTDSHCILHDWKRQRFFEDDLKVERKSGFMYIEYRDGRMRKYYPTTPSTLESAITSLSYYHNAPFAPSPGYRPDPNSMPLLLNVVPPVHMPINDIAPIQPRSPIPRRSSSRNNSRRCWWYSSPKEQRTRVMFRDA